jgi:hypothetical protein
MLMYVRNGLDIAMQKLNSVMNLEGRWSTTRKKLVVEEPRLVTALLTREGFSDVCRKV